MIQLPLMKTLAQQLENDGWKPVGNYANLTILARGDDRKLVGERDTGINYKICRVDLPKLTEEGSLEAE